MHPPTPSHRLCFVRECKVAPLPWHNNIIWGNKSIQGFVWRAISCIRQSKVSRHCESASLGRLWIAKRRHVTFLPEANQFLQDSIQQITGPTLSTLSQLKLYGHQSPWKDSPEHAAKYHCILDLMGVDGVHVRRRRRGRANSRPRRAAGWKIGVRTTLAILIPVWAWMGRRIVAVNCAHSKQTLKSLEVPFFKNNGWFWGNTSGCGWNNYGEWCRRYCGCSLCFSPGVEKTCITRPAQASLHLSSHT